MPTTWISGYAFRFYSSDGVEPPHVHVLRGGAEAKIWLGTLTVAYVRGYNRPEMTRILTLTAEHQQLLLEKWNGYFNK